jgi:protein-tyrosine-phosphatase
VLRVVFVCTGNLCRSPMAEGILRHYWQSAGYNRGIVSSMGVRGLESAPASAMAIKVCLDRGIDISAHRSRPLNIEELAAADIIFTMEPAQKEYVQLFSPSSRENTFLLGAWPGKESAKSRINDPMGGSEATYIKIFQTIEKHIYRLLPDLMARYG